MKKLLLIPALALLSFQAALADWVVIQKVVTDGAESTMTLKAKGDKSRMDMGDKMSLILDTASGDTVMFIHGQKMMMKISPESLKAMMAMAAQSLGGEPAAKPVATDKNEKVGEHDCTIYTWSGKIGNGKFWVAKNFPDAVALNELQDKMMKAIGNPMASIVPQNSDFPGMVVKSEMEVMGKKSTAELVSAKQEPVADDAFKAPEGYQEMKMPALPGK
ncbi:MAG: DUF4412 domain-containing protein [Verrucomicrobiota bacterium]